MRERSQTKWGQGLVEFALILPVLLMVVIGTLEFGRIFLVYVTVANGAREGARYGMAHPTDPWNIEIAARDHIALIDPQDVAVNVGYDPGPDRVGEWTSDPSVLDIGWRVVVALDYTVEAITPVLQPFIPGGFRIETTSARTIPLSAPPGGTPIALPTWTPTPDPGSTDTPVPTPTDEPTATATATATATVTPGPTPATSATPELGTPTPTPVPHVSLQITGPFIGDLLREGATYVEGVGTAYREVCLQIIGQGALQTCTHVDADGSFRFDNLSPLIAGDLVRVYGYGTMDDAYVEGEAETPDPTEEPTPPPTPSSGHYVALNVACVNPGTQTVTVSGARWGSQVRRIRLLWDGGSLGVYDYSGSLSVNVPVTGDAAGADHTLLAIGLNNGGNEAQRYELSVPVCVRDLPDLTFTSIEVVDSGDALGTYEPVNVRLTLANVGVADATSVFWVHLYVDYDPALSPVSQAPRDTLAIHAMAAGSTVDFTMQIAEGFATLDEHSIVAYVDPFGNVEESEEGNNQSDTILATPVEENPAPTPVPPLPPDETGSISGYARHQGNPTSNVAIYAYDGEFIRGSGVSGGTAGYFIITNLPTPGGVYTYTLVAKMSAIEGGEQVVYIGVMPEVDVTANTTKSVGFFEVDSIE